MPFLCIYLVMELLALVTICHKKKRSISSSMEALNCSAFKHCKWSLEPPAMQSITKNHPLHGFPRSLNYSWKPLSLSLCGIRGSCVLKKGLHVVSPGLASPGLTAEHLRAREDAYQGVVIDPESLPLSTNAFASALRASLGTWKLKEKRGVWLKILQEQAELVPIAIQEGFSYHHAEPGYVVLTYWIPSEPCTLPASPSHQIGIAGFVINDRGEILVVKEQCSCSCSGVWKLPTGYINKSEDIFSGAVREVKEETGVDTTFLEMVAFRHAHLVAFEKSDLMFVCLLKPLSFDITIDEKEIQAAKWMPVDEVLEQPFYREDQMSRRIIEVCKATYEEHYYCGFTAHQLISLFDGNLASCLYYSDKNLPCFLPSN